ncbi:MAG: PIN domain-containing protein [Burkholderiales bacterium]|nr:MAG: PIN domain-containing protein [Burkholderiales bacterium]
MSSAAEVITPALPPPADRPAVVIDTQVVMDWLVFRDDRVQALALAVTSGAVRWLVAPAMRDEIRHVLGRGVAAAYAPDLPFIESQFDAHAEVVAPPQAQPLAGRLVCRDPDDQKFIDLALEAGVRWLVSRDKAVLQLAKRARVRGLEIVKPESWCFAAQDLDAAPVVHSPT